MPLTEAGIYAAALRLIDADGVEAFTMRKLAAALDANPMSLYHHVPNKDAVLRGVAGTVGAQFRTVTLEGAPWQERIRLLAMDFRTMAHRHPKLMGYSFHHQVDFITPEDPFCVELTAILDAAGVRHPELSHFTALVGAVVIGVVTAGLNGALHRWSSLTTPSVGEEEPTPAGRDENSIFRLALDTMIMGMESQFAVVGGGQRADH